MYLSNQFVTIAYEILQSMYARLKIENGKVDNRIHLAKKIKANLDAADRELETGCVDVTKRQPSSEELWAEDFD